MYLLLNMEIFYGYVSLPEGTLPKTNIFLHLNMVVVGRQAFPFGAIYIYIALFSGAMSC